MNSYGLHWFRRDLRVAGNPALGESWKRHQGRVLGVFFFDSNFLSRPDFSHRRFAFFMDTLAALRQDLRKLGGDLLVLDRPPREGFKDLIEALKASPQGRPATVSFNRDYEPFARSRDADVSKMLSETLGIEVITERDHLLLEPHEVHKEGQPGSFYQVYSPFSRRWHDIMSHPSKLERIHSQARGLKLLSSLAQPEKSQELQAIFHLKWNDILRANSRFDDQLEAFQKKNAPYVDIAIPEAGSAAAWKAVEAFKAKVSRYGEDRDFPSIAGTSRLSVFLKNGSITTAQILARLGVEQLPALKAETGLSKFYKELIWREFYYHIMFHRPDAETESFNPKYRSIQWENNEELFEAWKEGRTGYAIVDAGMRELKTTGWMHNRVRMIVASFLTKDLLIDWRWGEKYFMEALLDGDLAPNNGGWQWAASTGCDPQPYFRIFNPVLQGQKFDPDGHYIRRYVPERKNLSGKAVHEPIRPIVDHAQQKHRALKLYTSGN